MSKFIRYPGNTIFRAVSAGPVLLFLLPVPALRNGLEFGRKWTRASGAP